MSTEFRVHRKYLLLPLPEVLEYQASDDYCIIGTRFCNGSVTKQLEIKETGIRLKDSRGWIPKDISQDSPLFKLFFIPDILLYHLEKTNKPYFSQWSKDSPIYFYDTPCRWCWHTLDWDFWSKALSFQARLYNDNNDKEIKTWKQLYDAIYGINAHMQDKGEGGGTYCL